MQMEHAILMSLSIDREASFLCRCGAVLKDAAAGLGHLGKPEERTRDNLAEGLWLPPPRLCDGCGSAPSIGIFDCVDGEGAAFTAHYCADCSENACGDGNGQGGFRSIRAFRSIRTLGDLAAVRR